MALSCYLVCWSVQTALLVLLAAATGARLVVTNLDKRHHGLRACRSLAALCQKVGTQDTSSKASLTDVRC